MPRRDFKEHLNTKYKHAGGYAKLEEIMTSGDTGETLIVKIMLQFGITYRQATRWLPKYRSYSEVS